MPDLDNLEDSLRCYLETTEFAHTAQSVEEEITSDGDLLHALILVVLELIERLERRGTESKNSVEGTS